MEERQHQDDAVLAPEIVVDLMREQEGKGRGPMLDQQFRESIPPLGNRHRALSSFLKGSGTNVLSSAIVPPMDFKHPPTVVMNSEVTFS